MTVDTPKVAADTPAMAEDFRKVFAGLMLVLTLAALDQSIVSTALPRIVSDLGAVSRLSWIVTIYVLASTVTMPLYGKLSDQYGRKPLLYTAIGVFLIGSILAGLAGTMNQLILFRAIQGLGAGGLMPLAQITIGDLVSPRERGRYQGMFGGVFAICSVAGPVLGGVITDLLSWHWIFYINLPVGAVAAGFIAVGLKRPAAVARQQIDYLGAALIALATTGLLLIVSLGGSDYSWLSGPILGCIVATALLIALIIYQERRVSQPVLPLHLFSNRTVSISWLTTALTFMGLMGATVFFPLYFQLVLGVAASKSGLMTGPLMLGIVGASVFGGRIVTRTGRYKMLTVSGLAVASMAFLCLAWEARTDMGILFIEPVLLLLGLGMGLVMPTLTVALQNAVQRHDMGTATGTAAFFRSLGGVIGVAVSGGILTMMLASGLQHSSLAGHISADSLMKQGIQQIAAMPPEIQTAIAGLYSNAIAATFLSGAVITGLAFVSILFLPELPLQDLGAKPSRAPIME